MSSPKVIDRAAVRALLNQGVTQVAIARRFGVSPQAVNKHVREIRKEDLESQRARREACREKVPFDRHVEYSAADLAELPTAFRFWVDVDDETGCWIWDGTVNPDGTGVWKKDGVQKRPRRWAWELSGRAIPDGTRIYRTCSEPTCVNPDHTEASTMADRTLGLTLGRNVGESNPSAVLTADNVREIRKWYLSGMSARQCALRAGMGESTVWAILSGRTWKEVTEGKSVLRDRETVLAMRRVPKYVMEIRRMYQDGMSYLQIHAELGVSTNTINGILSGRTWKHVTGGENIVRPPGPRPMKRTA